MSRLIVLSNRVKMPDNAPIAGGLAVALNDVLIGKSVIWMGWNSQVVDNHSDDSNKFSCSKPNTSTHIGMPASAKDITYMTIALTSKQYRHFYCGFANSVLWLLLHERTSLISQTLDDYAGYQEVNRLFARQLKEIIKPDDVIWIHDYHFLSVAYYCRKLGLKNRIGFFLHIPFAPLIYWQQLEQSAQLIKHLAHCDLIGTQTKQDKANCITVFKHYLIDRVINNSSAYILYDRQSFSQTSRTTGIKLGPDITLNHPHYLTINAYPISVNVEKIQQQVDYLLIQAAKSNQNKNLTNFSAQQIIAVDRIDYSKGLLERFSAYQHFLQQHPTYQNKLKFLQIACPSRLDLPVYQQHYDEVRQAVNDVNQHFFSDNCYCTDSCQTDAFKARDFATSSFETNNIRSTNCKNNISNKCWQAITYSETVLNHEKVMKAFWHSDIGWVNSLKDGMNLVAKEYIAAQNPDNPGVLLLSRYAGAAEQMQAAVIIDPYQPNSIIKGLETALTMPLAQRKSRYQLLLQGLKQNDINAWQQHFLDDLYQDSEYKTDS